MKGLLGFTGASVLGSVGWWAAAHFGIMTAFFVSTIASGFGMYFGRRLAEHWGA